MKFPVAALALPVAVIGCLVAMKFPVSEPDSDTFDDAVTWLGDARHARPEGAALALLVAVIGYLVAMKCRSGRSGKYHSYCSLNPRGYSTRRSEAFVRAEWPEFWIKAGGKLVESNAMSDAHSVVHDRWPENCRERPLPAAGEQRAPAAERNFSGYLLCATPPRNGNPSNQPPRNGNPSNQPPGTATRATNPQERQPKQPTPRNGNPSNQPPNGNPSNQPQAGERKPRAYLSSLNRLISAPTARSLLSSCS